MQDLAVLIYTTFKSSKDFSFRDQICRAVVSISNNIAEGFDRKTNKEFIRFLYIANGSCSEVKSMLYLAERLHYIDELQKKTLINSASEINRLIMGLIKSISS